MSRLFVCLFLFVSAAFAQFDWHGADDPSRPYEPPWTQRGVFPAVSPSQPPVHGGFISFRELSIPHKALDAFVDAQRFSETGRTEKAITCLKRAIRIYPGYYEAYVNLGAEYYRSGDIQTALAQFEKAAQIGPLSAIVQTNLAVAYCNLGQLDDSEKAARRALDVQPNFNAAQYVLGYVLAVTGRVPQALPHLEAASTAFPRAQTLLDALK